jgi:hypothetical protein
MNECYDVQPISVAMLDPNLRWVNYSDGRLIGSVDGGASWCDLVDPEDIAFDESEGSRFLRLLHFDKAEHGWGLGWDRLSTLETKFLVLSIVSIDIPIMPVQLGPR